MAMIGIDYIQLICPKVALVIWTEAGKIVMCCYCTFLVRAFCEGELL